MFGLALCIRNPGCWVKRRALERCQRRLFDWPIMRGAYMKTGDSIFFAGVSILVHFTWVSQLEQTAREAAVDCGRSSLPDGREKDCCMCVVFAACRADTQVVS